MSGHIVFSFKNELFRFATLYPIPFTLIKYFQMIYQLALQMIYQLFFPCFFHGTLKDSVPYDCDFFVKICAI